MSKAWSEDRKRQAADLYKSGMSLVEVASAMNAGSLTIQKYLRELGVVTRKPQRRSHQNPYLFPDSLKRAILESYQKGYSTRQCAKLHLTTHRRVEWILKDFGCELRGSPLPRRRIDRIVEAHRSGLSICEIARTLKEDRHVVRKYLLKEGEELRPPKVLRGPKSPHWKGGRIAQPGDYVYIKSPDHPNRNRNGYVAEHRLVMESMIGRYLTKDEVVHHKNKNRQDNRPENLELFSSNSEHLAHELKGQIPKWSEEGSKRIREGHDRWRQSRRKLRQSIIDARKSPSLFDRISS